MAMLITQCLQNDFVAPIGRHDAIPNELHVGYSEARRILGAEPGEGALAQFMAWAHSTDDEKLHLVHIRDWHDAADPSQRDHLRRFGEHCLANTRGAEFCFEIPNDAADRATIIDSPGLNDFLGTSLASVVGGDADELRIGVIGVWTEAKVSFLCYELRTRFPAATIAVCSALTASSSRQRHFEALEHLQRILDVRVFDSVGRFVEFLGGDGSSLPVAQTALDRPVVECPGTELADVDCRLVRWLFRDCRSVELDVLDGGYSGNVVARSRSVDLQGHEQAPCVVKIGPQELIGRERAAFERIQNVLGNNAPSIAGFVDFMERGAIKYRYASMGGGTSTSFQQVFMSGATDEEISSILTTVFRDQLGRLYRNATLESCDLLEHYAFSPTWAPSVRRKVEALVGAAPEPQITIAPGLETSNICDFYGDFLATLPGRPRDEAYMATVHGDLNGANIVIDGQKNVWLIDFFHTRRAHVLMDLIKLENDILFIFTAMNDEDGLREGCAIVRVLLDIADLAAPLPECPVKDEAFARTWRTISLLRSFYPSLIKSDRDPLQLWIAKLRYSVHTLSFIECNEWQRKCALYASGLAADKIKASLTSARALRVDWLDDERVPGGRLGMTILPGRRDRGRHLSVDIEALDDQGVTDVVCLVTDDELHAYGTDDLLESYAEKGWGVHRLSIVDQTAPSPEELNRTLDWIDSLLEQQASVLVHCVGGLGRSGLVAAAYLKSRGASTEEAMASVRRCRGPRAIETAAQEHFLRGHSHPL